MEAQETPPERTEETSHGTTERFVGVVALPNVVEHAVGKKGIIDSDGLGPPRGTHNWTSRGVVRKQVHGYLSDKLRKQSRLDRFMD